MTNNMEHSQRVHMSQDQARAKAQFLREVEINYISTTRVRYCWTSYNPNYQIYQFLIRLKQLGHKIQKLIT